MAKQRRAKRLSREEQRQLTRQRLLDAAISVIVKKGYLAASVEEIAEEAGYSRGAFYSNFADKDGLFLALLELMSDRESEQLSNIFDREGNTEELRDSLRQYYAHTCTENKQFVLYAEAQIHALRNKPFHQHLLELERRSHARISGFVSRYFSTRGNRITPSQSDDIATGLMAITSGITFAQMLDPQRVDDQRAVSVLMAFFDAITNSSNACSDA